MTVKKKYKYIFIDTTNLFFKCYNSIVSGFEISQEKVSPEEYCQVINIMIELKSYIKREFCYDDSELFFLFDNSQSKINIRKIIDSTYKSDRDKKHIPKNIYSILSKFSNILKSYSDKYRILFSENLEADDLVKPLLNYISKSMNIEDKVLLISDDLDWSRSISDRIHWYNWKEIYDKENFYRRFEFFPTVERICIYKSFLGDYSDSIKPAVSNSFPKKIVIELLNRYNNLDRIIKDAHENKFDYKINNEIIRNTKQLQKNYKLVQFVEINKNIEDSIFYCKKNNYQIRLYLESLNIEIPFEFQTKSEIADNFFKF